MRPCPCTDPVSRLAAELADVAGAPVELERPGDAEHGDYATNVALRLAPTKGRPPRDLAQDIAGEALGRGLVESAEPAGPGFVNLWMSDAWLADAVAEILAAGDDFGAGSAAAARERIQVEMVSANPTGPLHVAHGRNAAYGDSVARLLAFAGHDVEREYYYNDGGKQMERFYASVEAVRRGEEPPEDGYRGDYIAELAAHRGIPSRRCSRSIEATLERFRHPLRHLGDREQARGGDSRSGGAPRHVRGATAPSGCGRPLTVTRRTASSSAPDGTPGYFAADAVYVDASSPAGFDRLIYVLGADHHGYVARLQALAEMLGHPRESLEVLVYQLVHLVERGEAKQMSKRRGDVVFLDELLDTIGVDAARWYLVSRGHDQTIELDVDLAKQRTVKNPVYYVQYAHARIAGILRNAAETGLAADRYKVYLAAPLAVEERELVKRLLEFPALTAEAAERRAPHAIPTYAIRVADDFHRFYHHHRVLGSEQQAFRLALARAAQRVVARCLDLIGVEAPEQM